MSLRRLIPQLNSGLGWTGAAGDHFDGCMFFNPGHRGPLGFRELLRWRLTGRPELWPKHVDDVLRANFPDRTGTGEFAITAVGHATFLIQINGLNLLTDPVWSERASPFHWIGPRRVRQPGIPWERLPRIDAVLISHSHFDHLDLATLRALHGRFDPIFVTGLGNGALLASRGMARSTELDWWQETTLADGAVRVTFVPARHWSNRGDGRHNTTLWGGFVIKGGGRTAYFAGDSGWFDGFATIRERCGAPEIALLPIGAYEPRWFHSAMHMNPEEAVRAHLDVGARRSLGGHFGVWQLTDEGIDEPIRALTEAREKLGVSAEAFRAPAFGETVFSG